MTAFSRDFFAAETGVGKPPVTGTFKQVFLLRHALRFSSYAE